MSMVWIAAGTATIGANSFEFTNIPQTFTHLQMRYTSRGSDSGAISFSNIWLNGSAYGTDYSLHNLIGDGSSARSESGFNAGGIGNLFSPGSSTTANCYAAGIADILDYTSTVKNKVVKVIHGYDINGGGNLSFSSGMLRSTSPVTRVGLFNLTFAANCRFDLYGFTSSSVTGA
jgi:hypothetical protein